MRLTRERARKELVTRRDYFFGGRSIYWYSTEYDLLNRPTNGTDSVSLAREWLYNRRSELAAATVGTNLYGYAYDTIGNRLWAAENAATNSYAANCLNQYTAISANANPVYDADGNMTHDGRFTYAYDAANRLVSVSSNGGPLVTNAYDWRGRRVRKATPDATYTFFYDGWNLVEERVAHADGTASTIHYHWGKDVSGTLQDAGGVGGLLYLTVDGAIHIPCYDANGNITRYLDVNGRTVAEYVYDAFGNILAQSGPLADAFRFRFSTKYLDAETGLYYYGYRFYSPDLRRWLNRDPKEEEGGFNVYGFCRNSPVMHVDPNGEDIYLYTGNNSGNPLNDAIHQTVAVDTWSDDCPPKKTGVRGFSFGYNGKWGWNWPTGKWLGQSSITLPGYWMVGEIYEAPVVGKIVSIKKTTPEQDKAWLRNMESREGTKDVYSVGRHNCRTFSQTEFNKVP